MGRRIKLSEENKLGEGCFGSVYAVGDKAVKVMDHTLANKGDFTGTRIYKFGEGITDCNHEYEVAKGLDSIGVGVPKPYGVFRVEIGEKTGVGFVMDKVEGQTLENVYWNKESNPRYDKLRMKANSDIGRAKSLGFKMSDREDRNIMVDKKGNVIQIDFGHCKTPSQLEKEAVA